MSPAGAPERARRLIAIVPWVAARDGATVDEICERFQVDRRRLLDDLETLQFVGVAPYTPDLLVEVVVEDDRVWLHLPQGFDRPLRLRPDQALALLAAARGAASVHGAVDGPLGSALEKLARALGLADADAVDVDLATADPATLELLRHAVTDRRCVELDYYAFGADRRSHRVVEPHRISAFEGHWYLAAHCRQAEAERVFRVDRISGATVLDERFEPRPEVGEARPFVDVEELDAPEVVLELAPSARWVVEYHPVANVEELPDGGLRVTMPVTAEPWLGRLLVTLGPAARVVGGDPSFADLAARTASRVLGRYE